jgi:hypothetical protein
MSDFWWEKPSVLFNSIQLFSHPFMTLEEQLNAISRLVLIVSIVMWLFDFKYAFKFMIISLLFIIIIYYNQKKKMQENRKSIENFITYVPNTKPSPNISYNIVQPTKKTLGPSYKLQANCNDNESLAPRDSLQRLQGVPGVTRGKIESVTINMDDEQYFCNDAYSLDNPNVISFNQKLARQKVVSTGYGENDVIVNATAHPLTKIPPVIVPPAYDLESWRDNNLIVYSNINTPGVQQEMYLSGYAESSCCDYLPDGSELVPHCEKMMSPMNYETIPEYNPPEKKELYQPRSKCGAIVSPYPAEDILRVPSIPVPKYDKKTNQEIPIESYEPRNKCGAIVSPYPAEDILRVPSIPVPKYNKSNQEIPIEQFQQQSDTRIPSIKENYWTDNRGKHAKYIDADPDIINISCGYNPQQLAVNLPSNYPAGNCQQDPSMSRFNDNLFTQTVTPGVYMKNQINEPINSNMGISFTQQFEPLSYERNDKGLMITLKDPNDVSMDDPQYIKEYVEKANYDNVFDPRFYGYGTSYRSYLEPTTGQTRFMYDDVNAVRMPNYITRSKVDHLPYADHYGPVEEGSEFGNIHNPNIRQLAQDSWFRDSITFRDDMTQRLMRKSNAEAWQKRMYPNSTRFGNSACRIK